MIARNKRVVNIEACCNASIVELDIEAFFSGRNGQIMIRYAYEKGPSPWHILHRLVIIWYNPEVSILG